MDVSATHQGKTLTVTVDAAVSAELTLGAVLPAGSKVASVTLDGRTTGAQRASTARGDEVLVKVHSTGMHTLVVTLK